MNQARMKRVRDLVDGVLLLDKPVGLSSNDALIKAKRILNAKKAGHTGTLDPFATGLLPLCFGEATKFSQDLLEADKSYDTIVHLGQTTDTGDTEGQVLESREVNVTQAQIEAVLAQFRGPIKQVPPMYSALKRDGKPLYEYAREGITLEREARDVVIHKLEFISYEAPFLKLSVTCSKGTYIRVLGEDIGKALGCGAHLNALRRTQVGALTTERMITLEELAAHAAPLTLLSPVDALLSSFPAVQLNEALAKRFLNGQRLPLGKEPSITVPPVQGRVRVYLDDKLLGTAILAEYSILQPERLIAVSHG
ncbi:tRNA pseudouridine(55) synthase TruB [Duganella sp. FT80W]|uniref:tRNA pseudouridine synthase B n=1 Tax=Duganella guangzhouensis TaxID=2666084 RepID=A0A6I2L510_9BURK|nr:tRNA pseudouridine(55) synthase TruB [Duganella guangzhouensis]MRW91339.1 tRNA pseudouridine(55) synthase TruB [Duganella guangzhouensis]